MLHVVTIADKLIHFQLLSPHSFFIKYLSTQPPRHFLGGCAVLEDARHRNCFVGSPANMSICSSVEPAMIEGFYSVCEPHLTRRRFLKFAMVAGMVPALTSKVYAARDPEAGGPALHRAVCGWPQ